jgi:hypothetical protein
VESAACSGILTIFGGGSQGDEPTVLQNRLDALQAASLTSVGLGTRSSFDIADVPFAVA